MQQIPKIFKLFLQGDRRQRQMSTMYSAAVNYSTAVAED